MKAKLSFTVQPWTGWTAKQPEAKTVEMGLEEGQTITSKMLGGGFDYSLSIASVNSNSIDIAYKGLVEEKEGGGINLNAPKEGQFTLQVGRQIRLSTPTLDGGTHITVALKEMGASQSPFYMGKDEIAPKRNFCLIMRMSKPAAAVEEVPNLCYLVRGKILFGN